jgi:hypothetical protein
MSQAIEKAADMRPLRQGLPVRGFSVIKKYSRRRLLPGVRTVNVM